MTMFLCDAHSRFSDCSRNTLVLRPSAEESCWECLKLCQNDSELRGQCTHAQGLFHVPWTLASRLGGAGMGAALGVYSQLAALAAGGSSGSSGGGRCGAAETAFAAGDCAMAVGSYALFQVGRSNVQNQ